ncbi:MAG: hypothetical protein EOP56_13845 [Sphingobacteriales bacterium]|nr:MAG: hypothetical protein EOP56_13845 [Sphingobacteriales bacterium]
MEDLTTLHSIKSVFRVWISISSCAAFVGFFVIGYNRNRSKKWLNIGLVMFMQAFVSAFIGVGIYGRWENKLRQAFYHYLNSGNLIVSICDKNTNQEEQLDVIRELKATRPLPQHRSGPREPLYIAISSSIQNSIVILRKDSQYSDEFWVYWYTQQYGENEMGRIRTNYFDSVRCD